MLVRPPRKSRINASNLDRSGTGPETSGSGPEASGSGGTRSKSAGAESRRAKTNGVKRSDIKTSGTKPAGARTAPKNTPDDQLFEDFHRGRESRKKRSFSRTEFRKSCQQVLGSRLFFCALLVLVIALGAGMMVVAEKYQSHVASQDFQARKSAQRLSDSRPGTPQNSPADEILELMDFADLSPSELRKQFESSTAEDLQRQIRSTTGRHVDIAKIEKAKSYSSSSVGNSRIEQKVEEYSGMSTNDAVERVRNRFGL